MSDNYYSLLELDNTCSNDDIKMAYKRLAIKWHPDKNKTDDKKKIETIFRNITKAYQILSNENTRKKYDEYGITESTDNIIDPYLLFSNIFDNDDIPDVIVYIDVDINDLYTGCTQTSNFIRYSKCIKCNCTGTYNKENGDCTNCKGSGILMETVKGGKMGYMINEKKCDICIGVGMNPNIRKCKKCSGNKYIKENIECSIDIPAGAYDGYYISLENEGNYIPLSDRKNNNNDRSNVKFIIKEIISDNMNISRGVFIKELKHIDIADILLDVDITFAESLTGIKKEINYLSNEKIGIELYEPIQNNDIYVVQNKGMVYVPEENKIDQRGNLFLRFRVQKPELNIKQKKKLWQIITGTPYQTYDNISESHILQSIESYISRNNECSYISDTDNNNDTDRITSSDDEQSDSVNRKTIKYKTNID